MATTQDALQFSKTGLRKVFANGGCLRVNITVEIMRALNITKGDTLIVTANDHQIVMEKAKTGKG